MTQEEKAKAYDEAIETARKINSGEGVAAPSDWTICEVIFPELKKSEDEKIKEELMQYLWDLYHKDFCPPKPTINTCDKWLAWLEKQGEQKSAWSADDEVGLGDAMWAIEQARGIAKDESDMGSLWYAERWLKSVKERMKGE